jgi:hypothetical protein
VTSKGLPIVDGSAPTRDTVEARTLSAAQRFLDDGDVQQATLKLAPLAEDPTTPVRAHAGLLYAGLLLMTGKARDAVAVLDRVPLAPAFPLDEGYRWMLTACALRTARRYDDALVAALRAVEQGATSGRLLVLADAQKHAGHLDDAAATLEKLLAKEPRHATALAQLAGYRNLAGAHDAGAKAYAAFRAVADKSADSARNEAFYFATRDELAPTLAALQRALSLEPEATRGYIDDEIELDRFRDSVEMRALLA